MKKLLLIMVLMSQKLFCQVYVIPTSSIACNADYSSATFTISSGNAPYSFTIQTPSCTTNYTASSLVVNPTFTFNCPGVYSFAVSDASNTYLGSATHTVILSTVIHFSISSDLYVDTVCKGNNVILYANSPSITPLNYTLSSFYWYPLGGPDSPIASIYPLVTAVYSVSALYTSATSRTCTATGSTTIYVIQCSNSTGIKEISAIGDFNFYPNPIKDKLTLEFSNLSIDVDKLTIVNSLGQPVYILDDPGLPREIYLNFLPSGLYYLKIENPFGQKTVKIMKE